MKRTQRPIAWLTGVPFVPVARFPLDKGRCYGMNTDNGKKRLGWIKRQRQDGSLEPEDRMAAGLPGGTGWIDIDDLGALVGATLLAEKVANKVLGHLASSLF